jgi:hypothetical protein
MTPVPELLDGADQLGGIAEGVGRGEPAADGGEVEDRERDCHISGATRVDTHLFRRD